jgi:hypothetical protein
VTVYPSTVAIETTSPLLGTLPTNVTLPPAAAWTVAPRSPPMSIPRCWPPAYGFEPMLKARSTAPSVGQVHASATPGTASASTNTNTLTSHRIELFLALALPLPTPLNAPTSCFP